MNGRNAVAVLIAKGAASTPDKTFIGDTSGRRLTYAQLFEATERLGAELASRGVLPGDRVALVLPNSIAFPVVYLTLLAHGITAVPINPEASLTEMDRILGLAKPLAVLVGAPLSLRDWRRVTGREPRTYIETIGRRLAFFGPDKRRHIFPGFAEILFTSGTTGTPKGVGLSEEQLLFTARSVRDTHGLTEDDVAFSPLPLHHINAEVVGILGTLVTGSTLVIGEKFSASAFWDQVRESGATWVNAVPPILAIMAKRPIPEEGLPPIRFVRSASAPLPVPVLEAFETTFGIPVIETYGLTEAGSQVAANPMPPGTRKRGSVGLPRGTEIRILDEAGKVVPRKVTGEIAVRGEGVVTRYAVGGETAFRDGWFLTGDLGFVDDDGYLFITGRRTDMVNRGGQKVAPREVEEVLLTHPAVADVAVGGIDDPVLGQKVAAWVVLSGKVAEAKAEDVLLAHAKAYLSSYKRPEKIFFVKELPKSAAGKVKRHLLQG